MKEIAPTKFGNVQTASAFQPWARSMKEYMYWHDSSIRTLIDDFEAKWAMDTRLSRAALVELCVGRDMDVETDAAIHMVVLAFLEGEAKVLAETAELMDSEGLGSSKSGLELWRLLKYNFDRSSAFNIIGVLEMIRGMGPAKGMHDVLSKIATGDRAHQEYQRQALASKAASS